VFCGRRRPCPPVVGYICYAEGRDISVIRKHVYSFLLNLTQCHKHRTGHGGKGSLTRDFLVFFTESFPSGPECPLGDISHLEENLWIYSNVKVNHRC
jgi:hypothetical protein